MNGRTPAVRTARVASRAASELSATSPTSAALAGAAAYVAVRACDDRHGGAPR